MFLHTKKSAIVKMQAAIIAIVIVVAAVAGVALYMYVTPTPSPAPTAKIPVKLAGKYIREDYPKDYIELKEDGTFYVPGYTGKWRVEGDRLILTNPAWEVWLRIVDDTLLDETTGRRYVKTTPTPSPTPTKPETPTPVPPGVARVGDFSIAISKVDRQENTTTLYFAITKVADTDSEGGGLEVTLTDDHGNQYSGTLSVNLGGVPSKVISLLPTGFTYVDIVSIPMPGQAPIETIRFGDEPEIGFKDLQLVEPSFRRDFGPVTIEPGTSVSLGKYLTFTFQAPASDIIGWTLPVTITNTEYNPLPVKVELGIQIADGRVGPVGSVAGEVPGSGKKTLEPRIFTISQAIQAIEQGPSWTILISFADKSTGEQILRLMPISAEEFPAIPERIAFIRSFKDLYVVSTDGTSIIQLFAQKGEAVAWSPNGTKIAFHAGVGLWSCIYVMDADGSRPTKIIKEGEENLREGVTWSPDGTKIAFCAGGAIYIANADGSDRKKLEVGGFDAMAPSWSPDGTKIAYFDGAGINTIKTDGSGKTRIWGETYGLPYLYAAYFPQWSPDGSNIAIGIHPHLALRSAEQGGITIIRADGSSFGQLPMGFSPAWSPDGTKLAYVHEGEIWITRVTEGSIPSGVKLTDGLNLMGYSGPGAEFRTLAWAPSLKLTPPAPITRVDEDVEWLAKVIASEAGSVYDAEKDSWVECTNTERAAVGWTVLNRLRMGFGGATTIKEVVTAPGQYAYGQTPTPEIKRLAIELLQKRIPDPTGGATHFFSPINMPWQGDEGKFIERLGKHFDEFDTGGGLHEVPGISKKVYFPSWTKTYVWVGDLENVRRAYFMFYRLTPTPMTGEIRIGSLLPLTGALATTGENSKVAIDIAVEEVNEFLKASGAKWTLRVLFRDTEGKRDVALKRLMELAGEDINFVIGPMFTGEVAEIKDYADANKILMVSLSYSSPGLAIPDDFIFRFFPPELMEGPVIARVMYDDGKRYVIPVWRGDAWADELVGTVKTRFEELGGTFLEGMRYETPPPREFSAEAADLASKVESAVATYGVHQVGVLYIGFAELEWFFAAASEYDVLWTVKWYGFGFWGMIEDPVVAEFSAATRFIQTVFAPTKSDKYQKVHDRLVAELGRVPFPWDASPYVAYDIVWALAQSLLAVNKYDSEAVREVLPDVTESIFGASGWIVLDENGDRVSADYDLWAIVEVTPGKYDWKLLGTYTYDTDSITWL